MRETAAVEEEDACGTLVVLAHLLGDRGTQGQAGEHERTVEVTAGGGHPVDEGAEAHGTRMGQPRLGGGEGVPVVDVGGDDRVPAVSVGVGDAIDPGRPAERRMREDDRGHGQRLCPRGMRNVSARAAAQSAAQSAGASPRSSPGSSQS